MSCKLSTPQCGRARGRLEQEAVIPLNSNETFKSAKVVKALPPAIVPTLQWQGVWACSSLRAVGQFTFARFSLATSCVLRAPQRSAEERQFIFEHPPSSNETKRAPTTMALPLPHSDSVLVTIAEPCARRKPAAQGDGVPISVMLLGRSQRPPAIP